MAKPVRGNPVIDKQALEATDSICLYLMNMHNERNLDLATLIIISARLSETLSHMADCMKIRYEQSYGGRFKGKMKKPMGYIPVLREPRKHHE